MSILVFLAVLGILIVVHEFGHFIMAKRLGVRVERFAIGFGPKLFSLNYDNTEFAVCLIPLGGYVKMAGDERPNCKGLAEEFYSKPPGHRALIVLMGPVVNYVMAYVCFVIVFVTGYPTLSAKVGELLSGLPAQSAGLEVGDKIIRIGQTPINSWEEMQRSIMTSKDKVLTFTVVRNGMEIKKTIEPTVKRLENIFGQTEDIRVVGIKPKEEIVILKYGLSQSLVRAAQQLFDITATTYKALYRIMTGAMSPKDTMTGPIGIYYIIKQAATLGISYLLYIMGIISASLAIFNFLPLPILDGGHLFFLAIEKIRKKALSAKVDEAINRAGLTLILCLAVFIFYSDMVRFGWFDKIIGLWRNFNP
ncbi:MAG TPA: RIP metalloprotease RseP [Candidatus Omnitrophota bacterium]|nr:RIP metalloprotease RseP [Candidatus Omnitrophota bacterium]HPD85009.1 RIP metalloprotease RseP [Candidatus Omnitrophota bacterium]HRZ03867.1 RIP metalloprotease RseP [Candidatus Omnitrophota bacterium]